MRIALTIGIMFLIFGIIGWIQEDGPYTFLDWIHPCLYVIIGIMVLINCLVCFLTM